MFQIYEDFIDCNEDVPFQIYVFFSFLFLSDVPLMCHRKFPASFWDSAYQSPSTSTPHSFHFATDAYLNTPLYAMSGFHKTWPYSLASQPHTYAPQPAHSFSYSSMDSAASRYSPHYGPFMMQSPASMGSRIESRHGQYDLAKSTETFGSSYYPVPRLGGEMGTSFNLESSSLGKWCMVCIFRFNTHKGARARTRTFTEASTHRNTHKESIVDGYVSQAYVICVGLPQGCLLLISLFSFMLTICSSGSLI